MNYFMLALVTRRLLFFLLSKKAHEKLGILGCEVKFHTGLLDQMSQTCPRLMEALIRYPPGCLSYVFAFRLNGHIRPPFSLELPLKLWLSFMVIRRLFKVVAHPDELFLVKMLAQDLKPNGKTFSAKPTGDREPWYPCQTGR